MTYSRPEEPVLSLPNGTTIGRTGLASDFRNFLTLK